MMSMMLEAQSRCRAPRQVLLQGPRFYVAACRPSCSIVMCNGLDINGKAVHHWRSPSGPYQSGLTNADLLCLSGFQSMSGYAWYAMCMQVSPRSRRA